MLPRRVLAVTIAVAASGAVVGAIAAVATVLLVLVATAEVPDTIGLTELREMLPMLVWVATFGAIRGAIAFPAAAWLVLRRVPIGRSLAGVGFGIILGALVGEWRHPFNPYSHETPGVLVGASGGFLLAVGILAMTRARVRHLDRAV